MISLALQLSDQQEQALDKILKWYKSSDQFFVLAGYAGSGKSTLSKEVARQIPNCAFAAYTGKAAFVLREKGAQNACTIHGLLYNYDGKDKNGDPKFKLKNINSDTLVIIDEYSMIEKSMVQDILSKCKKVLFIGDPAQLPPIRDKEQSLAPDFFLTDIHRQAADNSIIKWAHEIRNGNIPSREIDDGNFIVMRKEHVDESFLDTMDQVLVGKNKTKFNINNAMREFYGFSKKSEYPVRGDKMICLKNNHKEGLYNGMIFTLEWNAEETNSGYDLFMQEKEYSVWDGDIFGRNSKDYNYMSRQERFEYAYAITCHKSQGSEFESVAIFNEAWGTDKINWLYTAVTRAKEQCVLII
jgi:exodeoxyribonuclease V